MKALQLVERFSKESDARQALRASKEQVNFIGGRVIHSIKERIDRLQPWLLQIFLHDEKGVSDSDLAFVGLRRVTIPEGQKKTLLQNPRGKKFTTAKLREPLTDEEIEKFRHLKTVSGKKLAAMVPAWARTKQMERAAEFVPGLPAHVPAWTRSIAMAPQVLKFPGLEFDTPAAYIAEFNRLNSLKNPRNPDIHIDIGSHNVKGGRGKIRLTQRQNPILDMVAIWIATTNDVNGNPRRLFVVVNTDGRIVRVIEEGYSGKGAVEREYPNIAIVGRFHVTPGEYRDIKKAGPMK